MSDKHVPPRPPALKATTASPGCPTCGSIKLWVIGREVYCPLCRWNSLDVPGTSDVLASWLATTSDPSAVEAAS
jgi:hypothetical protein